MILKNKNAFSTRINSITAVLEAESGIYYEIDEIGTIIWEQLDSCTDTDKLILEICEKYGFNDSDVREDVINFLSECKKNNLISIDGPVE